MEDFSLKGIRAMAQSQPFKRDTFVMKDMELPIVVCAKFNDGEGGTCIRYVSVTITSLGSKVGVVKLFSSIGKPINCRIRLSAPGCLVKQDLDTLIKKYDPSFVTTKSWHVANGNYRSNDIFFLHQIARKVYTCVQYNRTYNKVM